MGEKVDRPPHGTLYERRFPGLRARPTMRDLLNTARDEGYLLDYRFEADALVVRRSWVEGPTLDAMFRRIPPDDRTRFSAEAFAKLLRQLDALRTAGLEHGAVHPGNVVISKGVHLIDVMSNASRLATPPEDSRYYSIWMWGPTSPDGRGWGRWDRVNLLRMCTLLCRGPDAWHEWWTAEEMIETSEQWVGDARRLFTADAEAAVRMETTLAVARRLLDEVELPPPTPRPQPAVSTADEPPGEGAGGGSEGEPGDAFHIVPIEEAPDDMVVAIDVELIEEPDEGVTETYPVDDGVAEGRAPAVEGSGAPDPAGGGTDEAPEPADADPSTGDPDDLREDPIRWFATHMDSFRASPQEKILRPEQEARALRAAVNAGLTPERARSALAEWLEGSDLLREETIRTQAGRTVMDGKHYGKWVRVRSVLMAEWLFTNRGMDAAEASIIVRQIIGEQGLIDEKEFRREWAPALERFLHKNCPRLMYRSRQHKRMIDLVSERGVPRKLAERWVKKFLAEGGYELKDGWF